ncbi:hypothetical protein LCGC14_1391210 [marine sediment metagenome]|uniref:Uncharacterized protein n=1 Tax=marine sediment metagenome TaxID=412755 RepID=A0A0F9K053_9ZZZZ
MPIPNYLGKVDEVRQQGRIAYGKATDGHFYPIKAGVPFGEPSLIAVRNSDAVWSRGELSPYFQKSPTGWLANLYGGVQSNDDFAAIFIPVDEMKLSELTAALWTYYFTNAETMGINMVVWVHDPADNDKRAEITQIGNTAGLEKAAGWNAHELNTGTVQFFYYGENVGSDLVAGTQYTWEKFQADRIFSTWRIYRISFEYGWEASGTFDDAWVADIKLNGHIIQLKPDSGGSGRIGRRFYTTAAGDITGTLAPKTPFRLLSLDVHVTAIPNAGELFTLTKDAGQDTLYDSVIYSNDLGANGLTSLYVTFEGIEVFPADDEIDVLHTNSQDDDYGVTLTYQTVLEGA